MRDYVNRLSRGKFNFEENRLKCKEEIVRLDIAKGLITESSFELEASNPLRGMVFASDLRVEIIDKNFAGTNIVIRYRVDGRDLKKKESLEGKFVVISEAGELEIPYSFKCIEKFVETSLGNASNLFHFTNLYQTAPGEAMKIFFSPDFKDIFLENDEKLSNIYDALKNREHGLESIEEFLIALNKKVATSFKLAETKKIYECPNSNLKDFFVIKKSGWGNFKLDLSCDEEFIKLENTSLNQDDFTGDICEVEYFIDVEKLHKGNNFAKIRLRSFNVNLDYIIEIKEDTQILKSEEKTRHRESKLAYKHLVMEYLDYRMNIIRRDDFVSHVREIVNKYYSSTKGDIFLKLALAQSFVITGEDELASEIIEEVKVEALASIHSNPVNYAYFLYVNSLLLKSGDYTRKVINQVRGIYESGNKSWQILWILFYLNTENEKNRSIRLVRLKEIISKGCTSPVMYYEALRIFNSHPELFRVLDDFELKVVTFGIRHSAIHENLARQIADVVDELKYASNEQLVILKILYNMYKLDSILEPLVKHLVRAGLDSEDNNHYIELAIVKGFKITRIYEYYISSCPRSMNVVFPKPVLMYFMYDNSLSREDKAFLYANILDNKGVYKEEYEAYERIIENFAIEQLKLGFINEDMSIIYKNVLRGELVNEDNANFISILDYINKITVKDKRVKAVVVKLTEKASLDFYELKQGVCCIPIYTNNSAICFLCEDGVIRKEGIEHEIKPLMTDMVSMNTLRQFDISNEGFLINWAYDSHKKGDKSEETLGGYKYILVNPLMGYNFKLKVNSWLIKYYYELNEFENAESVLALLIKSKLKREDGIRLIEIALNNKLYDEAYELGQEYGFRGVYPAKLLRLTDHLITNNNFEESKELDFIASYLFANRVYNEKLLIYMLRYASCSNEDFYKLWKACQNFGLDVTELSERVIIQMMFSGVHNGRLTEVFTDYYSHHGIKLITKAYLAYNSYLFIVKGKKANEVIYKVIERSIAENVGLADICYVAYLKEISRKPELLKEEERRELAQKVIDYLCKKNIMLSFYSNLSNYLRLPYNLVGATILECIASPNHKVMIHYILNESSTKFTSELMNSTGFGLFTYKFNLFYGDSLRYYFTIEGEGKCTKTAENTIEFTNLIGETSRGRFDNINDCFASNELRDYMTLRRVMESYLVEDFVVDEPFKMRKD